MSISVLIAADFCPKDRIADLIEHDDYINIFGEVKPEIENSDFSIVNFECPVRKTDGGAIKKAGPSLKCSEKSVEALRYAGFDCVTLANNHFYDQGEIGVRDTIDALDHAGILHVGGGLNLAEAKKVLYQRIKGKTIAIINCCEREWSIATESTGGSNPLDPIQQFYAIKAAKRQSDFVIVIVHGGIEHFQYPSPRMVETYRFFVDSGADAVINHHQHCFSGAEKYKGKPIFYGLGNFCFDWQARRTKLWDEGFMVRLHLSINDGISCDLIPYFQNTEKPGVHFKTTQETQEWSLRFDAISEVIADAKRLRNEYEKLLIRTRRKFLIYLSPYTSRITLSLYMRNLLPLFLPKKRLYELYNMLSCESHYDRMIDSIKQIIKND